MEFLKIIGTILLTLLLTLLKIIGVLLLILLLLLVLVLAAPVVYDLSGEWKGQLSVQGKISWLYHIAGVFISVKDNQTRMEISLFGRPFGKKKKAKKSASGKKTSQTEAGMKKQAEITEESQLKDSEMKDSETEGDTAAYVSEEKTFPASEKKESDREEPDFDEELIKALEDSYAVEDEEVLSESKQRTKRSETAEDAEGPEETEETSVFSKVNRILTFLKQPPVKKLFGRLWRSIRSILRHLRPSDLHLRARVGMDDPALTGRIMEAAAILYAFYYENIEITADFEKKVLEAEFSVKGWLVPGYLLIRLIAMAVRILLQKECRAFYKEIKQGMF
ncbi:MAG: DUF2953 domain-containing protein [Lachnospiraceae bacterium]|nr:DUF2953 domain-containing protein [Lachnospiraceae bacterium]